MNRSQLALFQPWWAKVYFLYANRTPPHRGKSWALRRLLRIGLRQGTPFVWQMHNGNRIAISPNEGQSPWSVGWTCFLKREWEPHIERLLNILVKPTDSVMDIGANIGYFTSIMARAVGERGCVWAFEPVPSTFQQLCIARDINELNQVTTFPIALGASNAKISIRFREDMMGSASAHAYDGDPQSRAVEVDMRRLDDMLASGEVKVPNLIKIDVEGHECEVIAGAKQLLKTGNPTVIFEYNLATANAAGWKFDDLVAQFRSCGDYSFFRIHIDRIEKVDPTRVEIDGDYCDFVASVSDLSHLRLGE